MITRGKFFVNMVGNGEPLRFARAAGMGNGARRRAARGLAPPPAAGGVVRALHATPLRISSPPFPVPRSPFPEGGALRGGSPRRGGSDRPEGWRAGGGFPLLVLLVFFFAAQIYAQTPEELDAFLNAPKINWAQACRWIYPAAGLLPRDVSMEDAMLYAFANDDLPKNAWAEGTPALRDIAFIVMRAYNVRGGLMYRGLRNRRYAFRELVYLDVLQKTDDPKDPLSGEKLFHILKSMDKIKRSGNG